MGKAKKRSELFGIQIEFSFLAQFKTWVFVFHHPDDPKWWMIAPIDQNTYYIGVNDIKVQSADACLSGVIRCGYGIWARLDDLVRLCLIKPLQIDSKSIDETHQKMFALAIGENEYEPFQLECEEDCDYMHLMDNLLHDASLLERELEDAVSVSSG